MQDFLSALGMVWLGMLLWLIPSGVVGLIIYQRTESKLQGILTAAILFLIPTWDLIPGLTVFNRYARELAGVRIFRTAEATGYLDLSRALWTFEDAVGSLNRGDFPYEYIEVRIDSVPGSPTDLFVAPGYWQVRLSERGRGECAEFEASQTAEQLRRRYLWLEEMCVVATRRDEPFSQYEYETSGYEPLAGPSWLPPVYGQYTRVVDRESQGVLGQEYAIVYAGWVSSTRNAFGFMVWRRNRTPDGEARVLRLSDIVRFRK